LLPWPRWCDPCSCSVKRYQIGKVILLIGESPSFLLVGIRGEVALNQEDYNKTWIYMPNGQGKPEVAYLVEPPPENRINLPQLIKFELYGR